MTDALVGCAVGSGFRRVLAERLPGLAASGSLVHLLLDELPPAVLISGSAVIRAGVVPTLASTTFKIPLDICAGWQGGGAMLDAIAETGVPLLGWGPPAPALDRHESDPLAWHEVDDLPPGSMRRRRLVDLAPEGSPVPGGPGGEPGATGSADASGYEAGRTAGRRDDLVVTVRYRDSYWEDDGTETVVHEYGVSARVDPETWTFTQAHAQPGPLPAPECPQAAASAGRLVGLQVEPLRSVVREEFTGTSTCTHLNDVFRSLADLRVLWELVA